MRFIPDYQKPKDQQVFTDIQWGFHYTHGSGIKCEICRSFEL